MYLDQIANSGNIPVLEKVLAFVEARQAILADNVANVDVPGYKAKQLDPRAFQRSLRRALDRRDDAPGAALGLEATEQFHVDDRGHLVTTPAEEPAQNILFHDRTNARLELLMTRVAENVMTYRMAVQLLSGRFEIIKTAIRGQI